MPRVTLLCSHASLLAVTCRFSGQDTGHERIVLGLPDVELGLLQEGDRPLVGLWRLRAATSDSEDNGPQGADLLDEVPPDADHSGVLRDGDTGLRLLLPVLLLLHLSLHDHLDHL